jgi:F-type H+-transporting ATPase subunit b
MLIDWFTVGAQALNFLLLIGLMKHFLYKPILNAIDEREKLIANELAEAESKRAEASKERDVFTQKNEVFEQQRNALLSQATEDAKKERTRLHDEARSSADAIRIKRQESLKSEEQNLQESISRRTQQEVFAIAKKALTDLAGKDLEEPMIEVFVRRLSEMKKEMKDTFVATLQSSAQPVKVQIAYELTPTQITFLEAKIKQSLAIANHFQFTIVPNLICGIELIANGQKISWSIGEYLTSLEAGVK